MQTNEEMARQINMAERLQFHSIDAQATAAMKEAWRYIEPNLDRLLDRFYSHIQMRGDLRNLIEGRIDGLKRAQAEHWRHLFSGEFGSSYVDRVLRIGLAHNKIGLEPGWYIGGYNMIMDLLVPILNRSNKWNGAKREALLIATNRALMLDMDMAITAYELAYKATQRKQVEVVELNARQVSAAAEQTSAAINQVSEGAQQQVETISEIAHAMEETVKAMDEVAHSTTIASDHGQNAAMQVSRGQERMHAMADMVSVIADNSEKINQITEVIEKIANQTNMLSLNAAIEAARAGEHGKGFAVVAEEVRKLAEHSANSVREITDLVEQASKAAQKGVDMTHEVTEDFNQISQSVQQTDNLLRTIASAMEEQRATVATVNTNMESLQNISGSNATAAEEITATVVDLAKVAETTLEEMARMSQGNR